MAIATMRGLHPGQPGHRPADLHQRHRVVVRPGATSTRSALTPRTPCQAVRAERAASRRARGQAPELCPTRRSACQLGPHARPARQRPQQRHQLAGSHARRAARRSSAADRAVVRPARERTARGQPGRRPAAARRPAGRQRDQRPAQHVVAGRREPGTEADQRVQPAPPGPPDHGRGPRPATTGTSDGHQPPHLQHARPASCSPPPPTRAGAPTAIPATASNRARSSSTPTRQPDRTGPEHRDHLGRHRRPGPGITLRVPVDLRGGSPSRPVATTRPGRGGPVEQRPQGGAGGGHRALLLDSLFTGRSVSVDPAAHASRARYGPEHGESCQGCHSAVGLRRCQSAGGPRRTGPCVGAEVLAASRAGWSGAGGSGSTSWRCRTSCRGSSRASCCSPPATRCGTPRRRWPSWSTALDDRGLAALAVKLRRYLDDVPAAMLDRGRPAGVPGDRAAGRRRLRRRARPGADRPAEPPGRGAGPRARRCTGRWSRSCWTAAGCRRSAGGLVELLGGAVVITTPDGRVLADGR